MPATEPAAPLTRRERKKLETRDRIVDCAIGLFASRGYEATTMDDIGECADVARATVFNYFARKDDILTEWFARRRAELATALVEIEQQTTDTAGRLRHALRGLARLFDEDPVTGRAVVRAWLRAGGPLLPDISATPVLFADTIRRGQEQGDVPPGVDAVRAGHVVFDAYLGVLYRWVGDDGTPPSFEENLLASLDLLLAGILRNPPPVP